MKSSAFLGLAMALACAGCASAVSASPPPTASAISTSGTPDEEVVHATFETDADLRQWRITGGQWDVDKSSAFGKQAGDQYAYLTWPTYYGSISSVTVRGGIADKANRNFRVAVGHMSAIFNWENGDVDLYRNGLEDGHEVRPRGLTPGTDHEIRFVQDGPLVRVLVDGIERWKSLGHLRGTVTIYPAVGSLIRIREVEIHGVPVPWIDVDGPSQRAP